ncbi:MAG TPA: hypothetical protein VFU81_07530, partial [Thermomicrobiales bacterium]|nr:hypothetical protein [Thermomicrobiales bacterium]
VNYRMSGEYIVISPIPANLVLRYGKRTAVLWPSRRIVQPQQVAPNTIAGKSPPAPAGKDERAANQQPPAHAAPPPAKVASGGVKLANMTALYSDKLTDTDHEH